MFGTTGQVAREVIRQAPAHNVVLTALSRAEADLSDPEACAKRVAEHRPDLVILAAAYTAVDLAETEGVLARRVNAEAPGAIARACASVGAALVHFSTDYVFDGSKGAPYVVDDATNPLNAYGETKLEGERKVLDACPRACVVRTSWVVSAHGKNFVKTMLRLAADRDEVGIVADQHGAPTSALDIADGILAISRNLLDKPQDRTLRGLFHMTGTGYANWAEFASEIFAASARLGGPSARVRAIATADYPTPARRPANSRLDCTKLANAHGVVLPPWRTSLETCVNRLIAEARAEISR